MIKFEHIGLRYRNRAGGFERYFVHTLSRVVPFSVWAERGGKNIPDVLAVSGAQTHEGKH